MDDAHMRSLGEIVLGDVDPTSIATISDDEAFRLAKIGRDAPEELSISERLSLALWAAKGGLVRQ